MWRGAVAAVLLALGSAPVWAQCTTNAGEIVDALYERFLDRRRDPNSQQLIQQLASGRVTAKDAVAAIAKSQEHLTTLWMPIVDVTFRQVRNAPPEKDRVIEMARRLAGGMATLEEVTIVLAVEEAGSLSPDTAVIALYKRLLGRDPSPEDVERHAHAIEAGGVEPLARAIVGSPEYRDRFGRNGVPGQGAGAYERPVRMLYRRLLDRDADAEGLARSVAVAAQAGFGVVIDQILNSAEYQRAFGPQGIPGAGTSGGRRQYCGVP